MVNCVNNTNIYVYIEIPLVQVVMFLKPKEINELLYILLNLKKNYLLCNSVFLIW